VAMPEVKTFPGVAGISISFNVSATCSGVLAELLVTNKYGTPCLCRFLITRTAVSIRSLPRYIVPSKSFKYPLYVMFNPHHSCMDYLLNVPLYFNIKELSNQDTRCFNLSPNMFLSDDI